MQDLRTWFVSDASDIKSEVLIGMISIMKLKVEPYRHDSTMQKQSDSTGIKTL